MYSGSIPWVSLSLVAVAAFVFYLFLRSINECWKKLGVPHVKPELFFGNTRQVILATEGFPTVLQSIYKQLDGHPFGGFFTMMTPSIVLRDTKLIKKILVTDFKYFNERFHSERMHVDLLSSHLIALKGTVWKEMRMRTSQLFSEKYTERVFFLVQECCNRLQNSIEIAFKNQQSRDFDVKDLLASFTTDVIGMCAFGIECGTIDNADSQFRRIRSMIFDTSALDSTRKVINIAMPQVAWLLRIPSFSSCVADFFHRIVMETIDYRQKNGIVRDDLMQLMISLKQFGMQFEENKNEVEITDQFLVAQMLMAFTLGFEMTSSTMSFCIHELALNTEIQNKARMEVDTVLRKHGGVITYEATKEMTYLDMVIAGQKFAMVEMKAGLAALLSRFEFYRCPRSASSPAPFEMLKVLGCPAGGLWVRLAPRIWLPVS